MTGYELEFHEAFTEPELDPGRWVAHYLPQWTTPQRSAARYELAPGLLRLRIDADQPAWRLEDGEMRVSNLQTGTFSGPRGSDRGQMRHRPDLLVETPQATRRLYTPTFGRFEASMRASSDPTCMIAFWLVGFEEDAPESSGEICVAEVFGHAVQPGRAGVNIGVKAHGDPRLHEDMEHVLLDLDATTWHGYAAEWDPEEVRFLVDDELVRSVRLPPAAHGRPLRVPGGPRPRPGGVPQGGRGPGRAGVPAGLRRPRSRVAPTPATAGAATPPRPRGRGARRAPRARARCRPPGRP